MEESLQKLDARSNYIKVRDNLIDELAIKIQDLQSLLSNIKVYFFQLLLFFNEEIKKYFLCNDKALFYQVSGFN